MKTDPSSITELLEQLTLDQKVSARDRGEFVANQSDP